MEYYTGSPAPATLQWYLNDAPVGVSDLTRRFPSLNVGDSVYCTMTYVDDSGSKTLKTETVVMGYEENKPPAVMIASLDTFICGRTTATFRAYNVSSALYPKYEWFVNGIATPEHLPTFSTDKLKDGDRVQCRMSVLTCSTGSTILTAESNVITVGVINPSIDVITASETICAANRTSFTAKADGIDPNTVYTWRINGNTVGTNGNFYVTDALKDGDEVSCTVSVHTASCRLQVGDTVKIKVLQEKAPTLAVSASADTVCEGVPVTFTATTLNEGRGASYQWMINGAKTGRSSKTLVTKELKPGDSVWLLLTTKSPCIPNNQLQSNSIAIQVKPAPGVAMITNDTSVMTGSVVQLRAATTGNTAMFRWKPEALLTSPQSFTTFSKPLTTGEYKFLFEATGSNGCISTEGVTIKVLQTLYMPNSFTPNGDGINDLFRVPPGSAFHLEEFSIFDKWGNKVFVTGDIAKGWDGRYKNKILPGTYVYFIRGKDLDRKDAVVKGTVALIR
ncbi:MAG: gliding motility-associated C-terminal domain-containing protein [Flavisolibacter sp.]|nr:gliding motility-associated C-terminal domain-containing protein [Flavisolibacter sp.]